MTITTYYEYICCLQQRRDYNKMIYSLRASSPVLPDLKAKASALEETILKYELQLQNDKDVVKYNELHKL